MLNNFQPVPQPVVSPPETHADDTGNPRRSAYAAMSDLREQFSAAGICTDQVWESIKAEYKVESRSHLTGMQWARIAAELQSSRREASLLKIFVDGIPDCYFRIRVFSEDPSVAIGRPRDIKKHHLTSEWFDFQSFANKHQTTLTETQGKRTTYFEPRSPITQPDPVSTPGHHQNNRFLVGIKATLKVSGKWETAPSVFHHFYDKYNLVELRDIEIGLDGLAKAGEIRIQCCSGRKSVPSYQLLILRGCSIVVR